MSCLRSALCAINKAYALWSRPRLQKFSLSQNKRSELSWGWTNVSGSPTPSSQLIHIFLWLTRKWHLARILTWTHTLMNHSGRTGRSHKREQYRQPLKLDGCGKIYALSFCLCGAQKTRNRKETWLRKWGEGRGQASQQMQKWKAKNAKRLARI